MKRNRNLVFSSVGDRNNVGSWLAGPEQPEFDLAVYYFGDAEGPGVVSDFLVRRKGFKFPNFHHFIESGALNSYDAVWVADDDIVMDTKSINEMFRLFLRYQLLAAQPSFDRACRRPWATTFTNPRFILRYTNFVENGVVLFSTSIIGQIKHTFLNAGTGFGVDFIWPWILGFPRDRIAVIDAVSCVHPNDLPSTLNEVVPRPLHRVQGTELLIRYGLLPGGTEAVDGVFVRPYDVEEYGGIERFEEKV